MACAAFAAGRCSRCWPLPCMSKLQAVICMGAKSSQANRHQSNTGCVINSTVAQTSATPNHQVTITHLGMYLLQRLVGIPLSQITRPAKPARANLSSRICWLEKEPHCDTHPRTHSQAARHDPRNAQDARQQATNGRMRLSDRQSHDIRVVVLTCSCVLESPLGSTDHGQGRAIGWRRGHLYVRSSRTRDDTHRGSCLPRSGPASALTRPDVIPMSSLGRLLVFARLLLMITTQRTDDGSVD